jgi:putative phosphoesterase
LQVLQIADFKVGVCHGHQVVPWGDKEALAILQRQMGVDILVTGHTHEFKVGAPARVSVLKSAGHGMAGQSSRRIG